MESKSPIKVSSDPPVSKEVDERGDVTEMTQLISEIVNREKLVGGFKTFISVNARLTDALEPKNPSCRIAAKEIEKEILRDLKILEEKADRETHSRS